MGSDTALDAPEAIAFPNSLKKISGAAAAAPPNLY
jgi:hypothetical protein